MPSASSPNSTPVFNVFDGSQPNVAKMLQAAGYHTGMVGKWHLGDAPQFHPNARGFDHFYGLIGGNSTYFPDKIKPGALQRNGVPAQAREYLTDAFGAEAIAQIDAAGPGQCRYFGQHAALQ